MELAFRGLAPKSVAYAQWTAFFKAVGTVWTAVILSFVYLLSVGPVSLGHAAPRQRPAGPLARPEPSFWRPHEPNPLGPEAAARHQF